MILLPVKTLSRKQNHADSLQRKPFLLTVVLEGSKRSQTVSAEAKYDGQSEQEEKTGRLVYTLSSSMVCHIYI